MSKEVIMSDFFDKVLKTMSANDLDHLERIVAKGSRWKVYFPRYQKKYGFTSPKQISDFWRWLRARRNFIKDENHKDDITEDEEDQYIDDELIHSEQYWYDESRDTYVVHIPSKKKPLAIKGGFWRQIKEAYSNWGGGASSVNEICRKFGLSRNTLKSILRSMGMTHDSSPWSNEHVNKSTEEELIQDLLRRKEESVLVQAERIEWDAIKRDANKYRNLELYSKSIRSNFETFKGKKYSVPKIKLKKSDIPYSIIISPTDFHWGKYSPKYTEDEYNREIAKDRLFSLTEELVNRISFRGKPEKIILAIGGDGLHIDNQGRSTTRGTLQDCDGTPSELVSTYVRLCKEYIDYLSQIANVHVFVIAGNHDYYSTTMLREALKGWFHCKERVEIEDSVSPRQSILYGKSLITFMHGDEGNTKDYPAIIAGESANKWGKSKWRFIFTGHLHTERELPTFGNVTVYRMPSLAGTDDWHFRKGYKSRKALIGYVVSIEKGVIATEICPVIDRDSY